MAENKDFIIQIKGLQIGKHEYDFPIDGSFFRNFENSQILYSYFDSEVLLEKGSGWMNASSTGSSARSAGIQRFRSTLSATMSPCSSSA